MKVVVTNNFAESCQVVADMITDVVNDNRQANLGLATGRTALSVYKPLIENYNQGKVSFKDVHTINLDEYVGIDPENENSYRYEMNEALFQHIDIDINNTYVPVGTNDTTQEVATFKKKLEEHPIDFQLLGTGRNGHIGFNEPSDVALNASVHIVKLDEKTIETNSQFFGGDLSRVPREAITMGVGDILKAKKIALIVTGDEKLDATRALLTNDDVTTRVPCTLLKTHRDATIVLDRDLYEKATK